MEKVGIVVNYFRKSQPSDRLNALTLTTELGLVMLTQNPSVGTVVLVDGSPYADEGIRSTCSKLGVQYLHAGKELSIPEAYNLGWRSLSEPFVGLMANDILPYDYDTLTKLVSYLRQPDIGCVFPYLSEGDWRLQNWRFFKILEQTCEPSFILLNLILFKRSVLESIGGVTEKYKGGYYDPILLINIRNRGFRVVLVGGTKVIHVDQLTKRMGQSRIGDAQYDRDQLQFRQEYTDYFYVPNKSDSIIDLGWPYKFWRWPLATTVSGSILWWLVKHIPYSRLRVIFAHLTLWIEPFITRYPAKHGKVSPKMFLWWASDRANRPTSLANNRTQARESSPAQVLKQ
jgi:GT2 family glycosyltransferase